MNKPKFTPGPYMARSAKEGGTYVGWQDSKIEVRGGPAHLVLAAVISDCVPEHKANGDLFAAAPDMYAALEAFVDAWDKSHQLEKTDVAHRMAVESLAKAGRR